MNTAKAVSSKIQEASYSIDADFIKMKKVFRETILLMNKQNLRRDSDSFINGCINNFDISAYKITGGLIGEGYLGCGEQAEFMMLSLKDESYDNDWVFTIEGIYVHYWVEATFKSEKIKIDPWRNKIELMD